MAKEDVQQQSTVADTATSVASVAAPNPTAAHGVLSEIETYLRSLKSKAVAIEHREIAKFEALLAKLRTHL